MAWAGPGQMGRGLMEGTGSKRDLVDECGLRWAGSSQESSVPPHLLIAGWEFQAGEEWVS